MILESKRLKEEDRNLDAAFEKVCFVTDKHLKVKDKSINQFYSAFDYIMPRKVLLGDFIQWIINIIKKLCLLKINSKPKS